MIQHPWPAPRLRPQPAPTRRALLRTWLALPPLLAACVSRPTGESPGQAAPAAPQSPAGTTPQPAAAGSPAAAQATAPAAVLQPTPPCADDDDVTPAQTEGPFFTRNSPLRTSLVESGIAGTRLVLTGRVLGTDCTPVARALIEFWQADDRGRYDNTGYRLRGHQFSADSGEYRLETIVPGLYTGRTRHIHVKVQAPNRPVLTTQLYFPNEPQNQQDGIFHADLVMDVRDIANGKAATFDFVVRLS